MCAEFNTKRIKSIPIIFVLVAFFGLSFFSSTINAADDNSFRTATENITSPRLASDNKVIVEEVELSFNFERGFFDNAFNLKITSNNSAAQIIYTVDCSIPSVDNGTIYTGEIHIDSTTIVKAVAMTENTVSRIYTQSYIFPASSANQAKKIIGFPETWGGAETINADYEMDPEVVKSSEYSTEIDDAFQSLPVLSLSMTVDEWFNPETGLYVGYPNTKVTREKPVTAEFIFNTETEENFAIECGVQNQGGTSIVKWKSPKQSMRLLFKEVYGPTRLKRKLFPDSEINSINTLVVDAMLNATWIHPWDNKQRVSALYFRDQLTSDLQNEMGWLSFHGRYVNLFLNGLYWGIYDLHERPDDAFLSEYLDAAREDFDVIKHNPDEIVAGTNSIYLKLLGLVRGGTSTLQNFEDVKNYLDIPAFIDYMILNFYLGNQDWAHQNYYAAKNTNSRTGFRFYSWDSEHVMRFSDVNYNNTLKNDEGGPTEIHTRLKENEEYRILFADAVYKHLFNNGALTPANFEKNFRFRANEIEKAIILESARWGDYREEVSNVTYTRNEYWWPEVNKVLDEYIPKRRNIVIDQLRNAENKLFPIYMPPIIEAKAKEGGDKEIVLKNSNQKPGDIFYTLDGKDPRQSGGGINGNKYDGKITINNSTILKTRYYSAGDQTWSALAEEMYVFESLYGEKIVINEIMYHPEVDFPEFIEIMNFGSTPVNLKGFSFSGGINYLFQNDESIEPGTGVVLSDDNARFKNRYDFNANGQYEKQLSNNGETLFLRNGFNQIVDSVTYSDTIPWPEIADGEGYSLELIASDLDNAHWSSWKSSEMLHGSPFHLLTTSDLTAQIYPNPFSDFVTIVLDDSRTANEVFIIDIFNQTGSKVRSLKSTSVNSKIEIKMNGVLPGLYFIRIYPNEITQFEGAILKAIKL